MDLRLSGRGAVITGAGAGIGRGIALALAREGVRTFLVGRREEPLRDTSRQIEEAGGRCLGISCQDLASASGCAAAARQAGEVLGRVDILINNAGGSRPLTDDGNDEVWDESFDLNFGAARRLTTRLMPAMKEAGWGRIINITGATAQKTVNAAAPAKAALQSWSRALATELAPFGVTVNCVAPGRINSVQILERLHPTQESRDRFVAENIPIGRFGEPGELGDLVAFLSSPLAGYMTGISIPFDGGMHRLSL